MVINLLAGCLATTMAVMLTFASAQIQHTSWQMHDGFEVTVENPLRIYWIMLSFGFFLVFHVSPGWAEITQELPTVIIIGNTTYKVVLCDDINSEITSRLPRKYQFQKNQAIKDIDKSIQYWLSGDEFLRSPDGNFAVPFEGEAPFVGYIDLGKKEFIYFKETFPPTGEEQEKGGLTRYKWTGVLNQKSEQSTSEMWLFVRRWDREKEIFSSHRLHIPLSHPEYTTIEMMKYVVVERVFIQSENEVLCEIVDENDINWARISTNTWNILAKGKPLREYARLGRAVYSPDKSEIYAVYATKGEGLVIFDAKTGEEKVRYENIGHYFNAFTFGPTFSPEGSVVAVSTPYQHKISLIDVKTHRVISEYKTVFPLAGIIFNKKELNAYSYKTFLPYE